MSKYIFELFIRKFHCSSILHRLIGEILLDHESHLEDNGMVEFAQVKTCELLDLFQTIDKGISMNEELAGRLGDIQIVLKELLDSKESFLIKGFDGALLEYLFEEHLAQRIRQLINKSGNAQILIRNNCLFGIEYLADFESHLRLLE